MSHNTEPIQSSGLASEEPKRDFEAAQFALADDRSQFAAFRRLIAARESVRRFIPDRIVPRDIIEQCLGLAQRAPSNCNSQPWTVAVVSGATRSRLAAALVAAFEHDGVSEDIPFLVSDYPPDLEARRAEHGERLYTAFGIGRDDVDARRQAVLRNLNFYDAPHAALLFMPSFGNEREAGDVGMFAQTLMLAFAAAGLASCPQTSVGRFAEPVKRILGIEDDRKFFFAIAFGYEDGSSPASRLSMGRDALVDVVRYYD